MFSINNRFWAFGSGLTINRKESSLIQYQIEDPGSSSLTFVGGICLQYSYKVEYLKLILDRKLSYLEAQYRTKSKTATVALYCWIEAFDNQGKVVLWLCEVFLRPSLHALKLAWKCSMSSSNQRVYCATDPSTKALNTMVHTIVLIDISLRRMAAKVTIWLRVYT